MTQAKYFQKLKHEDYVVGGIGDFKGADITETIKPILEVIDKIFPCDCKNISTHFKQCYYCDLKQKAKQIIEENVIMVE